MGSPKILPIHYGPYYRALQGLLKLGPKILGNPYIYICMYRYIYIYMSLRFNFVYLPCARDDDSVNLGLARLSCNSTRELRVPVPRATQNA